MTRAPGATTRAAGAPTRAPAPRPAPAARPAPATRPAPAARPAPAVRARAPRDRREPGEIFGAGFTLFADVLLVGLLTSLACLPVLTLPAAFAAACATLRSGARDGTTIKVTTFLTHLRGHLTPRGLAAGLLPPALAAILLLDHAVAGTALPGAAAVAPALALLALGAAVVGLRATALPPGHGLSVREALVRTTAEPRGTLLLAAAVLLSLVIVWSMPLLVPLLPGPLAFAATVVDLRSPATAHDD